MAAIRENILVSATARDKYIQGVKLLKNEFPGPTTSSLGIEGPSRPVSTYDLFVVWHHVAMTTFTPPTQSDRNAAHRGPVFLPWHRFMLLQLEMNLQRVLGNDMTFGLPYWDWAQDGELPAARQGRAAIWGEDCMGGSGSPVTTGPFAFDPSEPDSWRVRITASVNGQLIQANRGLRRQLGAPVQGLPTPNRLPRKTHTPPRWPSLSMTLVPGTPAPRAFETSRKVGWITRRFHLQAYITASMYSSEETCLRPRHPTIRSFISTTAM